MAGKEAVSIFDHPLEEAEENRRDEAADAEMEAGLGVPHERVRAWLQKLAQGEKAAPPS